MSTVASSVAAVVVSVVVSAGTLAAITKGLIWTMRRSRERAR